MRVLFRHDYVKRVFGKVNVIVSLLKNEWIYTDFIGKEIKLQKILSWAKRDKHHVIEIVHKGKGNDDLISLRST